MVRAWPSRASASSRTIRGQHRTRRSSSRRSEGASFPHERLCTLQLPGITGPEPGHVVLHPRLYRVPGGVSRVRLDLANVHVDILAPPGAAALLDLQATRRHGPLDGSQQLPVGGGPATADIVDVVGQFLGEGEALDTLGAVLDVAHITAIFRKRHASPG